MPRMQKKKLGKEGYDKRSLCLALGGLFSRRLLGAPIPHAGKRPKLEIFLAFAEKYDIMDK